MATGAAAVVTQTIPMDGPVTSATEVPQKRKFNFRVRVSLRPLILKIRRRGMSVSSKVDRLLERALRALLRWLTQIVADRYGIGTNKGKTTRSWDDDDETYFRLNSESWGHGKQNALTQLRRAIVSRLRFKRR